MKNFEELKGTIAITKDELIYLSYLQEELCFDMEKAWKSKYNSYVVYDYEPFCSDGFEIRVNFIGEKHIIKYVEYLLSQRREQIGFLENLLEEKVRR